MDSLRPSRKQASSMSPSPGVIRWQNHCLSVICCVPCGKTNVFEACEGSPCKGGLGQCHQGVGTQVPVQWQQHRSPHSSTVRQGWGSQAGRAWRDKDRVSVDQRDPHSDHYNPKGTNAAGWESRRERKGECTKP